MSWNSFVVFSKRAGGQLRTAIIGVWLVAFCYLGTFYIVLCALSAYQVLDRAKEISDDNEIYVTQLIQQSEKIALLQDRETELLNELEDLGNDIRALTRDDNKYWSVLDPIVESAGIDSSSFQDPVHYRAREADVIEALSQNGRVDPRINEFQVTLSAFENYRNDLGASEAGNKLRTLMDTYQAQANAYDSVLMQLNEYDANQLRIAGEIVVELRSLRPYFHILATEPESVLVFILAVAMGALGSTIHITQAFLSGETRRPMTWYFIRPLLGTVTAVAIYILAKAGQLVLDPTKATATMSPWFISFLAIISGLLSGAAIESISRAGRRFFESAEAMGKPRWGVRLNDKLATANVNKQDLSAALGVTAPILDSWADAGEPVPQHQQEIIAAWLHLPLREVFSDVEPAT